MKKYIFILLSLCLAFYNLDGQSVALNYVGSWPAKLNTKVIYWNAFTGSVLKEFSTLSETVKVPDSIPLAMLLVQVFDGDQKIYEKKIIYDNTPLSLLLNAKDYVITTSWPQGGLNPMYEEYLKERGAKLKRLYVFHDICLYYGEQESDFYKKAVAEREKIIKTIYELEDEYEAKFADSPAKPYVDALKLSVPDYRVDRKAQVNSMLNDFFKAYKPMNMAILNSPVYKEKLDEFINLSLEAASEEGDYNEEVITDLLDKYFYQIIDNQSLVAITGEQIREKMHHLTLDNVQKYIDVNYLAQCHATENDDLNKRLQQYEKLAVGKVAPPFTWKDQSGEQKKLSDFDYDYYVIVFWASWCGHCAQTLPKIHEFLAKQKEVMTLAIGLDADKDKWDFARANYPKWHHYQAVEQWNNPIAEDFAVYATPTIYVLGKDLKIKGKARNIKELEKIIK